MFKLLGITVLSLLALLSNAQVKRRVYYTYDRNKPLLENYEAGYADTFSIYGNKFRIRMFDTSYNTEETMVLEKLKTKWTSEGNFHYSPYHSFSSNPTLNVNPLDLNFDGFDDLVIDEKWCYMVFLYNPTKNIFVKSGFYQFDSVLQKIDGYSNLYFDYWDFRFDNYWSYLYTIKNYKRINLAILELKVKYPNKENAPFIPAYISIRKIKDDGKTEVDIIKSNLGKFNIKEYWLAHAKQFYTKEIVGGRSPNLEWPIMFEPLKQ